MTVDKLYEYLMSTLYEEETVNVVRIRMIGNPVLDYTVDKPDCRNCDGGVGCYSSTK